MQYQFPDLMVSPLPLNQRLHILLLLLFFDLQPCVLSTNALRQQNQVVLTEPYLAVADKYTRILNSSWKFNFSSQAPHLFASVQGLLQQWPNTFFPNGHSIVPCKVPAYTNLYHGRMDDDLPPSPEWFAFDIEMAFGIMGTTRNSYMLTYQNTRPVGCLYFDGESATLEGTGQLDTQMLFIYGNTTGNPPDNRWVFLGDEYDRASKLCQWVQEKGVGGLGWGVEGIVRMNAGFEMIWCNFTSPSLRLVSHLNVTAPLLPETPEDTSSEAESVDKVAMPSNTYYPLPTKTTRNGGGSTTDPVEPPTLPNWRGLEREPFREMASWAWFESATWHYGSSGVGRGGGENRVKPLTCGFLNFYSPNFQSQQRVRAENEQKSLNLTADGLWRGPGKGVNRSISLRELTCRRRSHDLSNITRKDASAMNGATERALRNLGFDKKHNQAAENCTGIDWSTAINDIVQRHDLRLRELSSILTNDKILSTSNITILGDWFSTVRPRTYFLVLPYFEYPYNLRTVFDAANDPWSISSPNAQLALSRCRSHYTRLLAPDQGIALNPEEATLAWAVEETLSGICNVVIDVGFAVEREWFRRFNIKPLTDTSLSDLDILRKEIQRWRDGVEELMAWLGWAGQWTECQPGCAWDEICYIPMWPLDFFPKNRRGGHLYPYPLPSPYPYPFPYPGRPGYPPYGRRRLPRFNDDENLWMPKCVTVGNV